MDIEISIEERRWEALALEALAERVFAAGLAALGVAPEGSEISLLGCDDARISELNAEFRGKPTPTNVLSWPAQPLAPGPEGVPPPPEADLFGEMVLGDIAISYDTCAREAEAAQRSLEHHTAHLLLHGLLHLLGYDHIRDRDAEVMEALETKILGKLGIDDPYS